MSGAVWTSFYFISVYRLLQISAVLSFCDVFFFLFFFLFHLLVLSCSTLFYFFMRILILFFIFILLGYCAAKGCMSSRLPTVLSLFRQHFAAGCRTISINSPDFWRSLALLEARNSTPGVSNR